MAQASEIAAQFDRWNEALATLDPDQVVALYARDAVLLPTLSNEVRHNHNEIRDYFVDFLKKQPRGTINESNIRDLGSSAVHSGIYTFDLTTDGVSGQARCRFTYVYEKIGADWVIVEHHSSLMPK